MNTERAQRLLEQGETPRHVARELGCSRKEVEALARELKGKKRSVALRRFKIALVVLGVLVIAGYYFYDKYREPKPAELAVAINAAVDSLPIDPSKRLWMMEKEFDVSKEAPAEIELIESLTARLDRALAGNVQVPQVKELKERFGGHFQPTIFSLAIGGTSRITSKGGEASTVEKMYDPRTLEVVFYPHNAYRHSRIMSRLMFYDGEWRALFIAAFQFADERWMDATFIHELWHAKLHRDGAASATAPMMSDLWIREELAAHKLEQGVLDLSTKGQYGQKLQSLATRGWAHSVRQFLARRKPADLQELDGLFQPASPEEREIRSSQYFLDLAIGWLEAHASPGENLNEKRIEAYRMLLTWHSTGVK